MSQNNMIEEIVNFVKEHRESTASIAVCRRILGSYYPQMDGSTLSSLQEGLKSVDPEEVEALYYIIK